MEESGTTPSSPVNSGNLQQSQYNQDVDAYLLWLVKASHPAMFLGRIMAMLYRHDHYTGVEPTKPVLVRNFEAGG